MTVKTAYEHIILDEDGVPLVAGTTTKVIELVLDHYAHGWSPEEMRFQHPHLTLGQIHSALAYYWDHQQELDKDIERRLKTVAALEKALSIPAVKKRLARLKTS
jgi:uncharacterized protein (DUF433 family)